MSEVAVKFSAIEQFFTANSCFVEKKWLHAFCAQQLTQFLRQGFPSKKQEAWKYTEIKAAMIPAEMGRTATLLHPEKIAELTDLAPIVLTFVNGHFVAALSHTDALPKEVIIGPFSQLLEQHEERIKPYLLREVIDLDSPFAKLNAALMTDGIFLEIPKNITLAEPIHLRFIHTQQNNYSTYPRNIILAQENSQVTVLEEHVSETAQNYFTNVLTEMYVADDARLTYYKLQDEHATATHIANVLIEQQRNSCVQTYFFSTGAQLAREDLQVRQCAAGAESYLSGLYQLSRDLQHIDHHIKVDHLAIQGSSAMAYKGILAKKSHAVFNGKVLVKPAAQHIQAHQENHNLLLSQHAEINTKPELEIYADEVKCTHGATVGQLDEEALFYLQTRGIEQSEAHHLLTQAFAEEIYSKINNPVLRQYLKKRMNQHGE